MGNTLSTSSDVLNSLDLTDTCGLDEVENIGNDLLTHSVRARDTRSRRVLVTKLYSVQPSDGDKINELLQRLHTVNKSIVNITGLLGFVTKKAGKNGSIIIYQRQYLPYNLADRVRTAPFFTFQEKVFIAYQLINAVNSLHSLHIVHGDIKPENILLTSSNTPYLSDFAPYKPFYIPDDNPYDLNFFFNRSTCIAPERFQPNLKVDQMFTETTPSADIFSLGCVLAYLFLENSLFDVSNILDYKNGKFSITNTLSAIQVDFIRELILLMVDATPEKRPTAQQCFEICEKNVPSYFSSLLQLSYLSQQNSAEFVLPDIISFIREQLKIEKPNVPKEIIEKEIQSIPDEATLSHSSQLAVELDKLTNQTEELHKHLEVLLSGQWGDLKARSDALNSMRKLTEQITVSDEKENVVNEVEETKKYFNKQEEPFISTSIILYILFSIRRTRENILEKILSIVDILIHYSDDEALYMIITPGLVDLIIGTSSNPIKSHSLKSLILALKYMKTLPPSAHLLFPNYICPAIEQTIVNQQNMSFTITYASYFSQLLELSKKLSLKEEDGSMKASEHEVLCKFFLESYKQMLLKKNFHITRNLIKSYSALTLFCGYQKSYNELLQYITQFQQSDPILIVYFLEQIPLVGKVYGTKVFELHFYPLLQQYLYSTHEYLVYQTLLSITSCISLDIISRSYIYSIIPSVCPLLVHPNITLRQTTALLLEVIASKLSDAQRHCFLLPHVNSMLRIKLFNITASHINASLLSSIPRNALRSFDRNDFSSTMHIEDIVTKLENTGVTNPDKCLSKLIPYLIAVKEHIPRLSLQQQTSINRLTDELKVHQQLPLWGVNPDDPNHTYIPMQNPNTPCPRDSSRYITVIKGSAPPRLRSIPDLGFVDSEIPSPKHEIIQGICVAHLTEHRAPITSISVGSNGIFFVTGDSTGIIKVWDILGVESLEVMRSKVTYKGPSGVSSIGTIAKSNGIVIGYRDGTIELHRVCVQGKKSTVMSMNLIKSISLGSKIIAIQKNADAKAVTIVCENGTLAVWDIRDKTVGIRKENDARLGYVSAMAVAPSGEYCIVGTNRGYLVCWDLRHTIANIGWRVPTHSAITEIVFIKEENIATNTRDGDVFCWDIKNQNLKSLLHFEDFGTEIPELSSIIEKVERSRFKPSFSMGPDDYGVQQLDNLLQNLQKCIAQSKNNIYLPYLINTSLIAFDRFIISGGSDHILRFWDVEDSQNSLSYAIGDFKKPPTFEILNENNITCIKCFPVDREKRGIGISDNDHHLDAITALSMLPSAQSYYLCSASRDGIIKIWK
ncbi:protein kinase, putative [Entamoeba histolytica HM-3:IMSS]|uniref:non-specific serine/threonine protein kinase n=2 Tax=Entamoeba histolytica TaxID=5759 RepID=M2Q5B0_ENTHI|nr:protein kinase, putative [Entamoeba histolytica KU27]EMS17913.1 protein kinase, putative [Entamoeba histolytica HM-3:IMSS]